MTDTHYDPLLDASWLAKDDMIIGWLRDTGRKFEPYTTPWMLDRIAEREGAFVDVGASTGWFAVPFAKRGRRVIAFECNPRAIQRLKENCALNDVSITLFENAASDRTGPVMFTHNPRLPLTSGGSLEYVPANRASETVTAIRLDDVIDEPVALLKIDVEGHERAVLAGAERLIAASRPPMVLEANTGYHEQVLAAWLAEHDYIYILADERNMLCLPRS
jgi:FkbM family methyltransferase